MEGVTQWIFYPESTGGTVFWKVQNAAWMDSWSPAQIYRTFPRWSWVFPETGATMASLHLIFPRNMKFCLGRIYQCIGFSLNHQQHKTLDPVCHANIELSGTDSWEMKTWVTTCELCSVIQMVLHPALVSLYPSDLDASLLDIPENTLFPMNMNQSTAGSV